MKRMGIMTAAVAGMLFQCSFKVSAQETGSDATAEDLVSASGADTLLQSVDSSVSSALEQSGISVRDPSSLTGFQFTDVLNLLWRQVVSEAKAPFQLLALLLILILFTAALRSVGGTGLQKKTGPVFELVCVLAAALLLGSPLSACFLSVQDALQQGTSFLLTFVPVFSGILAASGHTGTAVCYQTAVYGLANCVMLFLSSVLLPLLSMTLAMSLADGINPSVSLGGLIRVIQRVMTWLLGLCMAVFLGVLSIQSFVSGAADGASAKAVKYMVSSFVPVIGSAVSDAYAAVRGSLGILRSTTGVIGMLVMCFLFLPVFLHVLIYRIATALAAATADLFAVSQLARLFRNVEQVLAILFAVVTCFSIMFLVATAIVIGLCSSCGQL